MKMETITISTKKRNGRFYTPVYMVKNVLDLAEYYGSHILKKHIIDNSCGDGAFLTVVAERYCNEYMQKHQTTQNLAKELTAYIHGIEIDKTECEKCKHNLNAVIAFYGLPPINWDINCADTLTVHAYDQKMDYVVGNPPYVRIHNLNDSYAEIKHYSFAQCGMTDLYIVFYEIGQRMLNEEGILGYITPSSFFNSLAGKRMRAQWVYNNLIDKIVDLQHYQVFDATTYTSIAILKKNRQKETTEYYRFDSTNSFSYCVDTLQLQDFYIGNNFYFADKKNLTELKQILAYHPTKEHFAVKNGFATLYDSFFIGNFDSNEFTIPIVKASTGKQTHCIFPYKNGKLVPFATLTTNKQLQNYYENHKTQLLSRSLDNPNGWYGFGRTQGISDVYRNKYAIR